MNKLDEIDSSRYLQIVTTGNMDEMFDFGQRVKDRAVGEFASGEDAQSAYSKEI